MNDEHLSVNEYSAGFSVKNAVKVLFVLFLSLAGFVILASALRKFILRAPSPLAMGFLDVLVYGIIVAVVYLYAKRGSLYPWQALGLRKVSPGKTFILVLNGIIAILVTSFLYGLFLQYFHIPNPNLDKAITKMFGTGILGLVTTFFIVVVVAPFAEELLFRGFLYQSFKNSWGISWAIIITSLLFAFAHVQALVLLPVYFTIGAVLAFVREKGNSIIPSIILHALNNFVFFLALLKLVR